MERGFKMPCNFPVGTYRLDGSHAYRPCGSCIQCRLGYAKDWAVRCVHEAQMYDKNCFLTLTYNDDNIPKDGSVHKSEMQKFIKKLRRKIEPVRIRFFGAGEYGENFGRPHYHVCVFNYDFPDKKIFKAKYRNRKKRDLLYISEMLENTWSKGFTTIGEVNMNSAGYVARYVTKKITGKKINEHYKGKNQEFALMSRMPGIGATWFEKYKYDIYPKDYHVLKGEKVRPPRYYDTLMEKENPKMMEEIRKKRLEKAEKKDRENDIRKLQKEKYRSLVTRRLERKLENARDNNVCVV